MAFFVLRVFLILIFVVVLVPYGPR